MDTVRGTIVLPKSWPELVTLDFNRDVEIENESSGFSGVGSWEWKYDDHREVRNRLSGGTVVTSVLASGTENYYGRHIIEDEERDILIESEPLESFHGISVFKDGSLYDLEVELRSPLSGPHRNLYIV